jgi:uridylate kinase
VKPKYRRILLKLSGEALGGARGFGIDPAVCQAISSEIKRIVSAGVQMGIVIGGGNIFRGESTGARMTRTNADAIGMLATVINSLVLREHFSAAGVDAVVLSANRMEKTCGLYTPDTAIKHLKKDRVVLIAGGTGNPFFTTDTAAALRCAEISAEVILKATKVDGVYDSDPVKNPKAKRIASLTHHEALSRNLKVMDATAFSFCMVHKIPIIVFKLEPGNILKCIEGKSIGSMVTKGA